MSTIRIGTKEERTDFRPGDVIEGAAGWDLAGPARAIEIRFFWHTRGKGTADHEIVESLRFEDPPLQDARPFRFVAPDEPYSFSGRLISVIWVLEVIVLPKGPSARKELIIGPEGHEIILGDVPDGARS